MYCWPPSRGSSMDERGANSGACQPRPSPMPASIGYGGSGSKSWRSRLTSAPSRSTILLKTTWVDGSRPTERGSMPIKVKQGDLGLLQHATSKELLESKIPARLAYVWTDGTPRVVPIWFHWNGREIVMASPPKAPKLKALAKNPRVSLTIDDNTFPHKVLLIRGSARLEPVEGIVPEYEAAAARYFDADLAKGWLGQLRTLVSSMVRITVTPDWVGLLDFQTRFPSALTG